MNSIKKETTKERGGMASEAAEMKEAPFTKIKSKGMLICRSDDRDAVCGAGQYDRWHSHAEDCRGNGWTQSDHMGYDHLYADLDNRGW